MSVKLLTEHHLEVLSLKGGGAGSTVSDTLLEITCRGSYTIPTAFNVSASLPKGISSTFPEFVETRPPVLWFHISTFKR